MSDPRTASLLRQEFDHGFALPQHVASDDEDLIGVEVGGAPHALRLEDISGVLADLAIVSVPSSSPHLVGIVGVRGEVLSVFDLAALLGYPRAPRTRWMAVGKGGRTAFSFTRLIRHLRVPRTAIVKASIESNIEAIVTSAGDTWPVVSLDTITAALERGLKEK